MKKLMAGLKKSGGFTLIEILVVIGIIAILAAIVIIAINPAKQFAQARNTQRQAGVNTVLNAIGQRLADNKGIFAGTFTVGAGVGAVNYTCPIIPAGPSPITDGAGAVGDVDLSCLTPTYVATIPEDPDTTITAGVLTGYTVAVNATGRITVCAPQAANEGSIPGAATICVTR